MNLAPSWVTLRVCSNADHLSTYTFVCPVCRVYVSKPAPYSVANMLTGSGCRNAPWRVPGEALEPHNGPPITYDDILDAHLVLDDPRMLHAALAAL